MSLNCMGWALLNHFCKGVGRVNGRLTPDQSCYGGADVQTIEDKINECLMRSYWEGLAHLQSVSGAGFKRLSALDWSL